MAGSLAFGIRAGPDRSDLGRLGSVIETLGYAELWVNDTRRDDGLATLAAIAPTTTSLRFGVGVVALSEQSAPTIAERVRAAGLPSDRLTLGVGSGSSASLQLVREGVGELRHLLPGVAIGVAAVGPRMARLAGEVADAVIPNWALPDRLRFVRDRVSEGADLAGRDAPRLVAYVRTAVGPGASERLTAEMERYRHASAAYARGFAAQPDELIGVAVDSADPEEVARALEPYRSVADTVVVRGLPPDDSVDAWLEVARVSAS